MIPENKLRFALTGRYIRPELSEPENHWKGDYTPDPVLVYNGDLPPASADASIAIQSSNESFANIEDAPTPGRGATPAYETAPTPGGGASPAYETAPTPGGRASPTSED